MDIFIQPSDTFLQATLLTLVDSRLTGLTPRKRYSLEAIVGPQFWEDVDAPHISLGRCFSDLVSKGRVPFVVAGFTSNRHNAYRYMPFGPSPEHSRSGTAITHITQMEK